MEQTLNIEKLQRELNEICMRFKGTMGYSLFHARHKHRIHLLGDEIFPTASTIKTAIMGKAFEEIAAGRLNYADSLPVQPKDIRGGAGLIQFYRAGLSVTIKELIHMMITLSDNTATIMLARKLETVAVNDWLKRLGLKQTRLLALRPDSDPELVEMNARWGMGMCTMNEMVTLLDAIRTGKAGTPAACDEMIRILRHQYFDGLIACQYPPWVTVASKSGAVDRSRSDTAIVFAPSGDYVLAVYTKEAEDIQWTPANEGEQSIRQIAQKVWAFYHSQERWRRPEGVEKFY
jgi:beta-lactamase class A